MDQSVIMNKFKAWHIDLIEKVQKITGLSNYQIIWISFIEGLTIGFIVGFIAGWWVNEKVENLGEKLNPIKWFKK